MARTDTGLDFGNNGPTFGVEGLPLAATDNVSPHDPDSWRPGIEPLHREFATGTLTTVSGTMQFSYFRSRYARLVTSISVVTTGTAAGATPTLVRYGLYLIAADGSGTLVASTTTDTAIAAATNTEYPKAITTPAAGYALVKGARYAVAFILTTGAALPTLAASVAPTSTGFTAFTPIRAATFAGQTDLPATLTSGNQTASTQKLYHNIF